MKSNRVVIKSRATLTACLVAIGLMIGAPHAHGQQMQNQRAVPTAVQAVLWQITRVLAGLLR